MVATEVASDKAAQEEPGESNEEPTQRPPGHLRETVVLVVLSITAVLTAWCGFELSQWSADRRFADALLFNQRGDNYTILTVIFALVLFFAAASSRLGSPRTQWILLGVAIVFLIIATVVLLTFPIDI